MVTVVSRANFRPLRPHEWTVLEHQIEAFEEALQREPPPNLDDFRLDPDPTDGQLLIELVFAEFEFKLRRGQSAHVEDYIARYPELRRNVQNEKGLRALERDLGTISLLETIGGATTNTALSDGPPIAHDSQDRGLNGLCNTATSCDTAAGNNAATSRFAHFDLLKRLGVGGFGVVWQARDRRLDRIVAVKIPHPHRLDARSRANLLREGRAAARLRHAGIVAIHDVDVQNDEAFVVYEFIDGMSLGEWLLRHRPSLHDAARKCLELTHAVGHAHACGIVHRDLKPGNILVSSTGSLHVTDFGLAKRSFGASSATRDGVVIGSIPYMSPEQAAGRSHTADPRTDVYGLGVILYELLTGHAPFEGGEADVLQKIQHDEPRSPRSIDPSIPVELQAICQQAIAKSPRHRYQTTEALGQDLVRFLEGKPVHARGPNRVGSFFRTINRHRMALVACMATLVAFVSIAAATLIHDQAEVATQRSGSNSQEPSSKHGAAQTDAVPSSATAESNTIPRLAFRPRRVEIQTFPTNSEVWVIPRDRLTGSARPDLRIAGGDGDIRFSPAMFELAPGEYLVCVLTADGRYCEFFRRVPLPEEPLPIAKPSIDWHPVKRNQSEGDLWLNCDVPFDSPPFEMVRIPAGEMLVGQNGVATHRVLIPAFDLAAEKLNYGDYQTVRAADNRGSRPTFNHDSRPYYIENVSFAPTDIIPLAYADADSIAARAGCRVPDEIELSYVTLMQPSVAIRGLDMAPDELTASWDALAPWTVDDSTRKLQQSMQQSLAPLDLLPIKRPYRVFETTRLQHSEEPSRVLDSLGTRAVAFYDEKNLYAVRAARSIRPRRSRDDFIRVEAMDSATTSPVIGSKEGPRSVTAALHN